MGTMGDAVRRLHIRNMGRNKWNEHRKAVQRQWDGIRRAIAALPLDFRSVVLYQDGLPVGGHERAIVAELAAAGSENHRILLELADRGATLTGTESPELLLREYELTRRILSAAEGRGGAKTQEEWTDEGRRILDERDRFIAHRIHQTLQPDQVGLLFLGMLHAVEGFLPDDIEVRRLEESA